MDPPDRERVIAALRKTGAVAGRATSAAVSVALVLVVVLFGAAVVATAFNPLLLDVALDSPGLLVADEPHVFEAVSGSGTCAEGTSGNATATNHQVLSLTSIVVTGNVSLPSASYVLEEPTITEQSGHRYILDVDSRPANGSEEDCPGAARYSAKIQLPYGVTDYELVVRHDGNRTLRTFSA